MGLRIRTRLTLASAGLVAVILVAAGVFVYVQFEADLRETVDLGLRSRADALLSSRDPSVSSAGLIEADEAFAQILSADGDVLESTPGVAAAAIRPGDVRVARFEDTSARTVEEVVPARVLLVPVDDERVLVVGASVEDQEEALARLAALLLIGGPAALALVVIVVWLIVGAALRPVEAMRSEAAAISASEPDRRLPVGQNDDELARLGRTLNEMLERLQRALERERRFVDDASHELRTPLANLKAELDLSIRRARTPDELEAALRSAAEETDRLVRLAEDLLVLARAKGGSFPSAASRSMLRRSFETSSPRSRGVRPSAASRSTTRPRTACARTSIPYGCGRRSGTSSTTRSGTRRRVGASQSCSRARTAS